MTVIYLMDATKIPITDELLNKLGDEENKKINKATTLITKQEHLGGRLLLNDLLETYSFKQVNTKLDLFYSPNGKPYLKNSDVYFSISHTNGIVACAIAKKPIGIDIEEIKPFKDEIIKKVMSNDEKGIYFSLSPKEKINYFYELWTAKESYVKKNDLCMTFNPANIILEEDVVTKRIIYKKHVLQISLCGDDAFTTMERYVDLNEKSI